MNFKQITSADNPQFKQLKKLANNARERRKSRQTILDGVHLLHALADAGGEVELLVLRQGSDSTELKHCIDRFGAVPGIELSPPLFDLISPVETPTGLLALYFIPEPAHKNVQSAVLLENIQDPGNLGTILRTAAAAGIDAIYLSKGCAEAWSPKSLRSGMGAQFVVAVFEQQTLNQVGKDFDHVFATRLDAERSIYDVDLKGKVAFLFGNEGAGLSDSLADVVTDNVIIPMPGNIESLNVAASVAVCLFERVRQVTKSSSR